MFPALGREGPRHDQGERDAFICSQSEVKSGAQRSLGPARDLIHGCDFQIPHSCHVLTDGIRRRRLGRSRGGGRDGSRMSGLVWPQSSPTQVSLLFPRWHHRGAALDQAYSPAPTCTWPCLGNWLSVTLGTGLVTVPYCVLDLLLAKGMATGKLPQNVQGTS